MSLESDPFYLRSVQEVLYLSAHLLMVILYVQILVSGILAHAGANSDISDISSTLVWPRIHGLSCISTLLCSILAPVTLESTVTNFWSLSTRMDVSDTRTIQTIAMIVSSGKRVSYNCCIGRDQTRGLLDKIR